MRFTILDACEYILEEQGILQAPFWLSHLINEMGLRKVSEYDVRAALDKDIAELGEKSRFVKVADDEYALTSWITDP